MSKEFGPAITGIGSSVPEMVIENRHFVERGMDTSDEWITKNTGIKRRHIAANQETTSDLGAEAAKEALAMAELDPGKIGQIIVATVTPDTIFPSAACRVQDKLQTRNASAFDISAACAGSIYGLAQAYFAHEASAVESSLVIGSEIFSRLVDPDDRHTAILFGDGAGAVVVQNIKDPGIHKFLLKADGSKGDLLIVPAGGSRFPASRDTVDTGMHYVKMKGHDVFKEAVTRMSEVAAQIMSEVGFTDAHGLLDQRKIDLVIPHQANQRIIDAVGKKLGIPKEKMFSDIAEYGNTSAASIFIAMHDAYKQGKMNKGDTVLLVAFGSGFTYAAGVLEWHIEAPKVGLREKIGHIFSHKG